MEDAKGSLPIGTKKAMMPPESIRTCRRAWATHSRPIQQSWIASESPSEAMRSLDAHQAAADYPMTVSTLEFSLLLSNIRSIQCAHCVPPSSIYALMSDFEICPYIHDKSTIVAAWHRQHCRWARHFISLMNRRRLSQSSYGRSHSKNN
jgi:hypothetical protein